MSTRQLTLEKRKRLNTSRRADIAYLRNHPSGDPTLRELADVLEAEWWPKGPGRRSERPLEKAAHNAHAHFRYRAELEVEIAKLSSLPKRQRRAQALRNLGKRYGIGARAISNRMKIKSLRSGNKKPQF